MCDVTCTTAGGAVVMATITALDKMPTCCVVDCENRTSSGVKFFRIPAGSHPFQKIDDICDCKLLTHKNPLWHWCHKHWWLSGKVFSKHYPSLSTLEVPKWHLRNTQVQSCDNVCIFVAMATFPKWWPVWSAHVAVSAIFKNACFCY